MIKPEPAGHDILVAVKAIAVNPVDTKVRAPKDKVEEEPRVISWFGCQTPDMVEQHKLLTYVAKEIDVGNLKTTINQVIRPINAANLRKAHALIEQGSAIGKVVLGGCPRIETVARGTHFESDFPII